MINYLILDFVEYSGINKGYIVQLNREKVFNINNYWILNIHSREFDYVSENDINRLINRQIPFGRRIVCSNCYFKKLYLYDYCINCPYRYSNIKHPGDTLVINETEENIDIVSYSVLPDGKNINVTSLSFYLPKPLDNKLKDGSWDGLLHVLFNQIKHRLYLYIKYQLKSPKLGRIWVDYSDLEKYDKKETIEIQIVSKNNICDICIFTKDNCKNCIHNDKRTN